VNQKVNRRGIGLACLWGAIEANDVEYYPYHMTQIELFDLKSSTHQAETYALLAEVVYQPTLEKLTSVVDEYLLNPQLELWGSKHGGVLAGLIGIEYQSEGIAIIRHIVVHPSMRKHGIGHRMMLAMQEKFRLKKLIAETDRDAEQFYRRCGFVVTSLGEVYPGVERFLCELEVLAN